MENQSETVKLEFENGDFHDNNSSNHVDSLRTAENDNENFDSEEKQASNSQMEEDKTAEEDSSAEEEIDQTNGLGHLSLDGADHLSDLVDSAKNSSFHSSLAASLSFNLLNESSKLAIKDISLRERQCRINEKESNEVKDIIWTLNHMVHILENIKRVSRNYIRLLYELIASTMRIDTEHNEQLQQEILELETELKQWEHKYHVMSSFSISGSSLSALADTAAALFANSAVANAAALVANGVLKQGNSGHNNSGNSSNNSNSSNHHSSGSSSEQQAEDDCDTADNSNDMELMEVLGASRQTRRAALNGNNSSEPTNGHSRNLMMMMPDELCEMSMETTTAADLVEKNTENGSGNDDKTGQQRRRAAAAAAAAATAAAAAALIMNGNGKHSSSSSSSAAAASSPLIAAAMAAVSAATASDQNAAQQQQQQQKQLNINLKQFIANHNANYSNGHNLFDSNGNGSQTNGSSTHLTANTSANTSSSTPLNSGNAAKPLFVCDYAGCSYQTNMRQRLAMHKRAHAGEMLFSCDIAGCGYQSNYKGNIKIHKKHRHRIEQSGEQSTYLTTDTNGQQHKFRTRGRKRKTPPSAQPQTAFVSNVNGTGNGNGNGNGSAAAAFMVQLNNSRASGAEMKAHFVASSGGGNSNSRPSVIVSEEGVEAFLDACPSEPNGSSCDMLYSGNEDSAAKDGAADMPLYQCTVEGCHYSSKWKQCLTAHQFVHAGVKPFKCDYPGCNYRTNFKGNVNVHKRVHRASEFQCKFTGCHFSTPWKNSFLIHQRNHMPVMANAGEATSAGTTAATLNSNPQISNGSQPSSRGIILASSSSSSSPPELTGDNPLQMMQIEPELPVTLSVTTTSRRRGQIQQPLSQLSLLPQLESAANSNSISVEVVRNGSSTLRGGVNGSQTSSSFERTPLDSLLSENGLVVTDHHGPLLNEISVMQSHSGRRPNADLVVQQQQAASMAAVVNGAIQQQQQQQQQNGSTSFSPINGVNIKEEVDDEELEDDDEEEEEEEEDEGDDLDEGDEEEEEEEDEMLPFPGQNLDPSGMQAFLMSEAANAVSQVNAVHLAALRHAQNSAQSDLRNSVMFDISRYQEMI